MANNKFGEQILPKLKWGESYVSLLLGIIVVVIAAIIVFVFVRSKGIFNVTRPQTTSTTLTQEEAEKAPGLPKTYEVKVGDNLWSISEKLYKSGYNWVDIAKANNLANPDLLYAGAKLNIPDVKPRVVEITQPPNAIKEASYTVKKGDFLWEIAVRAYGDGFAWTRIAKENNLANPDLIFSGDILKIPR